MENYTTEGLLQQLMQGADKNYRAGVPNTGLGFLVSPPTDGQKGSCGIVHPALPLTSMPRLRRFTVLLREQMRRDNFREAGVLCELSVSMDEAPPEPMVVIYLDQKYAGMRIFVAPRRGDHLVFRDLGTAHPATNFFPALFTAESYGAPKAEA